VRRIFVLRRNSTGRGTVNVASRCWAYGWLFRQAEFWVTSKRKAFKHYHFRARELGAVTATATTNVRASVYDIKIPHDSRCNFVFLVEIRVRRRWIRTRCLEVVYTPSRRRSNYYYNRTRPPSQRGCYRVTTRVAFRSLGRTRCSSVWKSGGHALRRFPYYILPLAPPRPWWETATASRSLRPCVA